MPVSPEYRDYVAELFESLGDISIRRMFSGAGVFYDGIMFALIVDDTLYLKVDDTNRAKFEAAGSRPYSFEKKKTGTTMLTSYYELPETLFDEPDALIDWARESVDVALRADVKKRKPKNNTKKPAR
jgi:DNA transformation protein